MVSLAVAVAPGDWLTGRWKHRQTTAARAQAAEAEKVQVTQQNKTEHFKQGGRGEDVKLWKHRGHTGAAGR